MRRASRIGVLAAVGVTLALTPRGPASRHGAEACGPYALDFAFVRVAEPDSVPARERGIVRAGAARVWALDPVPV